MRQWLRILIVGFAAAAFTLSLGAYSATALIGYRGASCYDAGRKVGGAEQRIFDDAANGEEPMGADQSAVKQGAPEGCK